MRSSLLCWFFFLFFSPSCPFIPFCSSVAVMTLRRSGHARTGIPFFPYVCGGGHRHSCGVTSCWNVRILVLWKTRIPEFSFCGKREFKNSCFVENETPRILVLWKPRTREFAFCGKRESENSRFVEIENPRILIFWKMRIREFSFCGKQKSENSRFVENENSRILVLWNTRIREFSVCGK